MDRQMSRTINKKISLLVAVSIVVIVVVAQVLSAFQLKSVMTRQSCEILRTEAENNAYIIDGWINRQADILTTMMESLAYMDEKDADAIMDYLEIQLRKNPDALMYYVCFAYNKSVLPADHSHIDLDPTGRDWWKQAVAKGGVIYTAPYVDFATGQMIVSVAAPLTVQNEQAVILADITIDHLVEIVNNISTSDDMTAFLLAKDGSVITHPNKKFLPNKDGNTILTDVVSLDTGTQKVTQFTDYDGTKRYAAVYTVDANGWKVGVTLEEATLSGQIQSCVVSNLWKISILAVCAIALLYFVLTGMLSPVNRIVDALVQISKGDFSVKLHKSGQKDEIGLLQNTVLELTDTLTTIVGDANRVMGAVASYDLSVQDMQKYPGDFDRLSVSINSVKNILCRLLSEIQETAVGVQNGSSQLASAADSLSQGSVVQGDSINRLMDEIGSMTQRIGVSSDNCGQANTMLTGLDSKIRVGNEEMKALLEAVTEIEQMSADMQKVMSAIDDIASQTNILALNASVEAARAGEHGRGFAIVAQEIRKLAENCAEEAKKTSDLLEGCIRAINETKKHADTTYEQLAEVEQNSTGISGSFHVISEEMEAQAKDSDNIQNGLLHIADVVHSNIAAAQQTAAASEELSSRSDNLTEMVRRFKV